MSYHRPAVHSISAADDRVVPLDQEGTQQLWEGLKAWFGVLNSVSEVFSGEALLSRMESLKSLNQLVSHMVASVTSCQVGVHGHRWRDGRKQHWTSSLVTRRSTAMTTPLLTTPTPLSTRPWSL